MKPKPCGEQSFLGRVVAYFGLNPPSIYGGPMEGDIFNEGKNDGHEHLASNLGCGYRFCNNSHGAPSPNF